MVWLAGGDTVVQINRPRAVLERSADGHVAVVRRDGCTKSVARRGRRKSQRRRVRVGREDRRQVVDGDLRGRRADPAEAVVTVNVTVSDPGAV